MTLYMLIYNVIYYIRQSLGHPRTIYGTDSHQSI
nr:MAG TPA: hypothetical protein [Bacteriophage sp.]